MRFVLSLLNETITRTIGDTRYVWICLRKQLEDAGHEFQSKGYDPITFP